MKTKKLDQVPGLDIMLRKFSSSFEKIEEVCVDLDQTRNDFVVSVNNMDRQIRMIKKYVEHQRGHFDQIFREDDI